jgi:hypothetical protein
MEIGQFPLSESGVPVLKLGPVLQRYTLARALEQVVIRKVPPAKAVEGAVQALK